MSTDWSRGIKIIEKLGDGTFGKVYLCQKNEKDDRKFVMKRVPIANNDFIFSTVQREYDVLSRLHHPRLIQFYGFYQCDYCWNFMLEYAPNGSLGAKINQQLNSVQKFFTQREILSIFTDILAGIKYLHYCCLVHRDLKPDNIVFDKYNRAKIIDFGICRIIEKNVNADLSHIGTPYYMAPEVLQSTKYDFKCDVWSLGIIFYEMCALQHPFLKTEFAECFDLTLQIKLEPIENTKQRRYHPGMNEIWQMMIVRDTKERATVDQVVDHRLIRNLFCTVFLEK